MERQPPLNLTWKSWKYIIQTTKEAIQWLQQGLRYLKRASFEDCLQQMADLQQKMYGLGALKSTNEEDARSIGWKQQICLKRGVMIKISQVLIRSSPNTYKSHTGKL